MYHRLRYFLRNVCYFLTVCNLRHMSVSHRRALLANCGKLPNLCGAHRVLDGLLWRGKAHLPVAAAQRRRSTKKKQPPAAGIQLGKDVDALLGEHAGDAWRRPLNGAKGLALDMARSGLAMLRKNGFVATDQQLRVPSAELECAPVLDLFGYIKEEGHTRRIPAVVEIKCGRSARSRTLVGQAATFRGKRFKHWRDTRRNRCMAQLALQTICVQRVLGTDDVRGMLLCIPTKGRASLTVVEELMCETMLAELNC